MLHELAVIVSNTCSARNLRWDTVFENEIYDPAIDIS